MTATGRIVGAAFYATLALAAVLTLLSDLWLQIFGYWLSLWMILRWWFRFKPNSLKVLVMAALFVVGARLTRQALNIAGGEYEQFIVDWGIDASPMECGGLVEDPEIVPPTHTAQCDIWSDPEKIIDRRVTQVLEQTKDSVREIEDFLHVNTPNKRERAGSLNPDAVIV